MGMNSPRRESPNWRLPPDEKGLRELIASLTESLSTKALHLMAEPHDARARHTFRHDHQRRAEAFRALAATNIQAAMQVAGELGLMGALEVA